MEDFWYIQCVFKLYFQSAFNVAPLSIILLFVDIYHDHDSFIEYHSIQNLFSLPPPPGGLGEGGGVGGIFFYQQEPLLFILFQSKMMHSKATTNVMVFLLIIFFYEQKN